MIEFCANIVIILQSRFIFNSFLGKFKIKECLMWQSGIVAKGQNKSATSCVEIADAERLTSFCSDCEWAVAHATRSSEGSQGCRED